MLRLTVFAASFYALAAIEVHAAMITASLSKTTVEVGETFDISYTISTEPSDIPGGYLASDLVEARAYSSFSYGNGPIVYTDPVVDAVNGTPRFGGALAAVDSFVFTGYSESNTTAFDPTLTNVIHGIVTLHITDPGQYEVSVDLAFYFSNDGDLVDGVGFSGKTLNLTVQEPATPVPEPTSIVMAMTGCFGLVIGASRRRQYKQSSGEVVIETTETGRSGCA